MGLLRIGVPVSTIFRVAFNAGFGEVLLHLPSAACVRAAFGFFR